MVRVTKLKLHRTISDIMNKGNLDSLTTKKIRLLCEAKYNTDLSERKKSQELRAAESNQVNVNNQRNTNADKNNVTSDEESSASEEDGSGDSEEEVGSENDDGSDGSEGNESGGSEEASSCSGSESCSDSECSSDSSDEEADSKIPASTSKKTAANSTSPKKASTISTSLKKTSANSASSKEVSVAGPSKGVAVIAGPSKGKAVIAGSPKKATANSVAVKKAPTNKSSIKKSASTVAPAKKASLNTIKRKTDKVDGAVQSKKPKKDDVAKKVELDDAALARQLQAEEWNFRRGTVNKLFRNTPQKKNEQQIKKKKPCPFLRKCLLSPALAEVLGTNEMSRPDIVQKMWSVVRERNLFDASNKQYALCDEQLKNVFGKKRIRLIGMMKYLKHHIKDIN